ncbi:hypothetical protein J3R30DRAFT_3710872 [Lentinula aciculospora]|uniref:Uncharacterized protein n=1 Tax=Lentinula aciculospora TaxID=153920 RepID=A0A9W9A1L0_9AGAR|nr:hypothetical protein J3R30DRAFT_3710872 [Lentinula aciculospora]
MVFLFHPLRLSIALSFASIALANTEIINFEASGQIDVHVSGADKWHVLSSGANEKPFNILPAPLETHMNSVCSSPQDLLSEVPNCPHEIWIKLDLNHEDWKSYKKFTLRISWPGSSPADFSISILNPQATASRFAGTPITPPAHTRVKFARIRIVDTGVISPLSGITKVSSIPFVVTLEPLYFGVIPASVVPLLWVLLPILSVSALLVPYANVFLQDVAAAARREMNKKKE